MKTASSDATAKTPDLSFDGWPVGQYYGLAFSYGGVSGCKWLNLVFGWGTQSSPPKRLSKIQRPTVIEIISEGYHTIMTEQYYSYKRHGIGVSTLFADMHVRFIPYGEAIKDWYGTAAKYK